MENSKKKVLFVITKGNFGGAQRYVYDLATSLPKDKFEAVVACGQGELLKERLEEAKIKSIELGLSQRDMSLTKDIKTFFEVLKIIKQERPDVVHVNSSKAGGLGAFAGRIAGVPRIIFTSHGWAFNEERGSLQKVAILFLHWLTIIFAHITIAVSHKTKKDIGWLPFIKNKIKVIHNSIDVFATLAMNESRPYLAGKNTDKTIIFSLSELHPNKGIDIALRAIGMLPKQTQEKIIYCVGGKGEELEELQNMALNMGISRIVRFLGFVSDGKKLLSGADIFLLPSRNENLPYAILEAGLTGRAIIATSVGGVPEIIEDMQSGILVHKNNPKEIAEAIVYLLDHKEKQKEFGEAIKQTIKNFFSLEKMLSQTTTLYF